MMCSCPKCNAQIEIDPSTVPDKGTFLPCSECKSRFWVAKEAYARMSLKKEGNIYCDQCGKELDHKIICSACGVMFPDYYLVQASKPPRRQVEKVNIFTMDFSLKSARPSYTYEYAHEDAKKTAGLSIGFNFKIIVALATVLMVVASLSYYYHLKKEEELYARNYVRALYTIKIGTDMCLSTCEKLTAEWKASARSSAPRISDYDESRLNQVKDITDKCMQKLNKPPKKYTSSSDKIARLYQLYSKAEELAVSPSGSLASFVDATAKSKSDFDAAARDVKANMPSVLSKEFQTASKRIKVLQNI